MEPETITLKGLAEHLQLDFVGDPNLELSGIATLETANKNQISFLDNPKYKKYLANTAAGAIILQPELSAECNKAQLLASHPYYAYAKVAEIFAPNFNRRGGIHPTATVAETAKIAASATVGPHCVIEHGANIAKDVVINAGCFIGENSEIGASTFIHPHVVIAHDVCIGESTILHSGVVIGSDGFGNVKNDGVWHKIPQLGRVRIGNNVEIGANSTIDRGALDDTIIGNGVRIDNQVHIAHGVEIGDHTAIAGCTGVSGSTKIGKHCLIGGGVGITGHLEITDNVVLTARAEVSHNVTKPGVYSSGLGLQANKTWQKNVVRFRHLDEMARKLKALEKKLAEKGEA